MANQEKYWFPAKRYGWGWGIPSSWQGWAVLLGFFVLLAVGAVLFLAGLGPLSFVLYFFLLCAVLLLFAGLKASRHVGVGEIGGT